MIAVFVVSKILEYSAFFFSPTNFSDTNARLTVVRYTIVILATLDK